MEEEPRPLRLEVAKGDECGRHWWMAHQALQSTARGRRSVRVRRVRGRAIDGWDGLTPFGTSNRDVSCDIVMAGHMWRDLFRDWNSWTMKLLGTLLDLKRNP